MVGAGLLGSLLLLIAEFTALFEVHVATASAAIKSVSVGSHHSYAIALIAICAAALTTAVWRAGSRPALAAVGILGLAALLIALIHDLPDASKAGTARLAAHYVTAKATPSAGFYMETLGAVLLMFSSVWGLLLTGAPGPGRTPSAV